MSEVRVRFAPSPTGALHLGGVRTALFNYLFARHNGGKFILRIEDTDKERSTEESVNIIHDAMKWLGMHNDEEILYQSKRIGAHMEALNKLIEQKSVYKCFCTPEDRENARDAAQKSGGSYIHRCGCRDNEEDKSMPFVWRFKMPRDGETVFEDIVQGKIITANSEIEDLVIAREDGSPLYNFVVVVDDAFQKITHVIRGKDHLTNTPKQINIYKALGLPVPRFAHLPLILGLSKRLRSAGANSYREEGYLPEALINYISRLGWSNGDKEIYSFEEAIKEFKLENVNRSEGSLDLQKMEWVNQQHIQNLETSLLAKEVTYFLQKKGFNIAADDQKLLKAVDTMRSRAKTLVELAEGLQFYFVKDEELSIDPEAAAQHLTAEKAELLNGLADAVQSVTNWNHDTIAEAVSAFIESKQIKLKMIAQPARVALVGQAKGPGLYETIDVLGKESTVDRLKRSSQI
ncbi:MAG: glutamate--tRNA ligase [Deltaproteobacteria bacterium]|nr:glutamate--tRNA ligase [Deltaproteobacteria bacterium]